MKNTTDITVIIPAYNAEKTIERCIDSIINQTILPKQIIIVNDGSRDKTAEKLKRYKNNRIVKVYNKINEGVSVARNYGLDRVKTEYVAFVDSDDYVNDNFLELLITNFYKNEDIDLSICGVTHYNEPQHPEVYSTSYKEGLYSSNKMIDYVLNPDGPQGYLVNKLWKMSIIRKYDIRLDTELNMAEDLLFTVTYLLKSRNVFVSNNCLYKYIHYSNSLSSGLTDITEKNFIRTNLDMLTVCKKIISMVSDPKLKRDTKVFLAKNASLFLRRLNLLSKENKEIKEKLLQECKKNLKYVLSSNSMTKKNKLVYISTIYLSSLIMIYDKFKIRGSK